MWLIANSILTYASGWACSNNFFNSITEYCVLLSWAFGVYEDLDWRVDNNDGKAKGSAIDLKTGIFNSEVMLDFQERVCSMELFCLV